MLGKIGEKVNQVAQTVVTHGKKINGYIQNIGKKIQQHAGLARVFVPKQHQAKFDKAMAAVGKVTEGSGKVMSGLERGQKIASKASKVRSLSEGLAVAQEGYYSGKNAVNSTRAFLGRPSQKSGTARQKLIQAPGKVAEKALLRAMPNKGLVNVGRGLMKPGGNGDVQKAMAAAMSAQSRLKKKPGRKR